jgi:hypothetical protein
VTGGRRFGYDNVDVLSSIPGPDGRPKRSHVELKINDKEAPVVVEIFEYCAGGKGYTTIAKLLNAEGRPCPRPNPGRPQAWAPSSVREILFRSLHRGEMVWNQTKKRNTWGTKEQRPRPKKDWITIPVPHLRIVSDELWERAHKRLATPEPPTLRPPTGDPGAVR